MKICHRKAGPRFEQTDVLSKVMLLVFINFQVDAFLYI